MAPRASTRRHGGSGDPTVLDSSAAPSPDAAARLKREPPDSSVASPSGGDGGARFGAEGGHRERVSHCGTAAAPSGDAEKQEEGPPMTATAVDGGDEDDADAPENAYERRRYFNMKRNREVRAPKPPHLCAHFQMLRTRGGSE